jgi:hypothetical protein
MASRAHLEDAGADLVIDGVAYLRIAAPELMECS